MRTARVAELVKPPNRHGSKRKRSLSIDAVADRSKAPQPQSMDQECTEYQPTASVLIVDDLEANRRVLRAMLEPLGHRIVEAASGREALACLSREDFAVVLLDVMMPGLGGLETATLLREQHRGREVPIIFMTGGDVPASSAYSRGAVDILRKPFDRDTLRAKVNVFVELFRAREQVRLQAERLIEQERSARARNTALLNASVDGIIGFDETGLVTEFNRAAEAMFGRSRADMLGRPAADVVVFPSSERETAPSSFEQYVSNQRLSDRKRVEVAGTRADRTKFPIELTVTRVETSGKPMFMAYARDLTERQQVESTRAFLAEASDALASSLDYETTLRTLASLAVPRAADWCSVAIVGADPALARLYTAHADPAKLALAEELRRRYPPDPSSARGIMNVSSSGRPELYADVPDALLASMARDAEHLRILRQIGVRSAMVVPIVTGDRTLGAISFVLAETRRKYTRADLNMAEELARRAATAIEKAELYSEARDANHLKDEFLATVSHELRTPLNAILGWIHLLKLGRPEHTARAIETIERNARAQARIIEDVLDVSRIITGKLQLESKPVNLVEVVRAAVETCRPAAEAKRLSLDVAIDVPGCELTGDPGRLQQIAWNLLSNAIKFTPDGGRVGVRLEGRGSAARLSVADTGQGIRPEFVPHVFERFRQADSATTRAHGGLGLGLAIVRHLVELHGGDVTAHSEGEGKGAEFVVTLPLRARAGDAQQNGEPESAASSSRVRKPRALEHLRVLVVDDEEDARDVIAAILEQHGAQVISAQSARAALDVLARELPDVLVSDIGMPDIDGYALIQQVRHLGSKGALLPAIALTAYAGSHDRDLALAAGYQLHMPKPVKPEKLVAAIARRALRE